MPRRYRPPRRMIIPDVRYSSEVLSQFIAKMMRDGKKSTAQQIIYGAMELVQERAHRNPIDVFDQAVRNVTPVIEVKPRRVGGATYQVPVEVEPYRRVSGVALAGFLVSCPSRPVNGREGCERAN